MMPRNLNGARATALVVVASFALLSFNLTFSASADDTDPLGIGAKFIDYDLVMLDPAVLRADAADGMLTLRLHGFNYDLAVNAEPIVRSIDVHQLSEDRSSKHVDTHVVEVYEGYWIEDRDARALVLASSSGVDGRIVGGDANIWFEAASYHNQDAPSGLTIVYYPWDVVRPENAVADVIDVAGPAGDEAPVVPTPEVAASHDGGPDRTIQMWADSDMPANFGSSWVNRVYNAYVFLDAWFEDEVEFRFNAGSTIWFCDSAACDNAWGMSSTDIHTLLPEWSGKVGLCGGCGAYDIAHLFSGKEMDDNTIGLAYRPGQYGVSQMVDAGGSYDGGTSSHERALLLTHEVGHNFNGRHERATSYSHVHEYQETVCGLTVIGICLYYTERTVSETWWHHTTMITPFSHQPETKNEMLGEFSGTSTSTNYYWLRTCNFNNWPTTGYYCIN